MIKELSEFGEKKRKEIYKEYTIDDSLILDTIDLIISITKTGKFKNIYPVEKKTIVEDVIRTEDKGRTSGILPRLLVDKSQYVLGYPNDNKRSRECHQDFKKKLFEYKLDVLKPIFNFYTNEIEGINAAYLEFDRLLKAKEIKDGNIGFFIFGDDIYIHEKKEVINSIIGNYQNNEKERMGTRNSKCSICGSEKYRSVNIATHGVIKRVPDGQSSGCTLVAYNADSFESYQLSGNNNSVICTHCIKNYIEGLNWLMTEGRNVEIESKDGKKKEIFKFVQRKDFGNDTAMVFWTRNNINPTEISIIEKPDPAEVSRLLDSVYSGKKKPRIDEDTFYSCSLSGAAARIAVRDWIEVSLSDLQKSIATWFKDIGIEYYNFETKKNEPHYFSLNKYRLEKTFHKENKDDSISRIATHLWNAALKKSIPPIWILTEILKRIRIMETDSEKNKKDSITHDRVALIKLVLNRNYNKGGFLMKEKLDKENTSTAYICGRIFSVLEGIQKAALGKDINAGIRERFFSFASTNPSSAFGRLMKMSQNHLAKLKGEKPGVAVILDKDLQELFSKILEFPTIFSLEEQGQFAIGYYHQKNDTFRRAAEIKELKAVLENNEDNTTKGE